MFGLEIVGWLKTESTRFESGLGLGFGLGPGPGLGLGFGSIGFFSVEGLILSELSHAKGIIKQAKQINL
jgi:hypothetical protein